MRPAKCSARGSRGLALLRLEAVDAARKTTPTSRPAPHIKPEAGLDEELISPRH